ncbi:hypothetical protein BJX61DRAFT_501272 [Aspergillus egyptiacus]|nr:hypothetical protein BJX61DRAFT_501272 [Aspergillus egyptiacus]
MAIEVNPMNNNNGAPRRLLLVSMPRTASNLLVKVLNIQNQPQVLTNEKGGYFFYEPFMAVTEGGHVSKPLDQWAPATRKEIHAGFQKAVDALEEFSAQAARENKMLFAKEHAFWFFNPASTEKMLTGSTNPDYFRQFSVSLPEEKYGPSARTFSANNETVLPDEYLRTWQMAFIIRHPALAWPSMYRAMRKMAVAGWVDQDAMKGVTDTNLSLRYSRMLYDWCLEQGDSLPSKPQVLDAYDVIHNPGTVVEFCRRTGLDPGVVQFEWEGAGEKNGGDGGGEAAKADKKEAIVGVMLSTLRQSTGVVKDMTPETVDIAAETEKWKAEFGEDAARLLEKVVWESMPDYEYLKARRIQV